MENKLEYPGFNSSEVRSFCGTQLKESEPREGIGVVAVFINRYGYKSRFLSKGDILVKDENGNITVVTKN